MSPPSLPHEPFVEFYAIDVAQTDAPIRMDSIDPPVVAANATLGNLLTCSLDPRADWNNA